MTWSRMKRWNTGISASSSKCSLGSRYIFSCRRSESMSFSYLSRAERRGLRQCAGDARVALVRGFHEQLRFFDQLVSALFRRARFTLMLIGAEEIMRELAAGERIEEQLGVVVVLAKFGHDLG